jgi:DNA-binding transcriptional MerR regulator
MIAKGFTRKEVMLLTGLKSGRLSYFDRTGLVQPVKIGDLKHPVVLYSWEQLIELKAIAKLREGLSLQKTYQIVEFLRESEYKSKAYNKSLLFINSLLCLRSNEDELGMVLIDEVYCNDSGQITFEWVEPLGELDKEIKHDAQVNPAINFKDFRNRVVAATL